MSRWKELPVTMDPRRRRLAVQLRRIKDHSGLTLRTVAVRTGYSRSSWDRYLNGKALPPRSAVAAFVEVCGGDVERLLALHEVAAEPGDVPPEESGVPEADGGGGEPSRGSFAVVASVLVAAVVVVVALALVIARPWDSGSGGGAGAAGHAQQAGPTSTFVFKAGVDHPCKVHRADDGRLYAGYSRTRTGLIGSQSAQWRVVEAQCLLREHGFPAGIADGFFGPKTERAVKRIQARYDLARDGVVGEDTWRVLRR
ncbi:MULTISPECIES: helix-turn-helix domain-containing protein [unclassified Streptomyces]|uniref:helix-turn-helix domain-containing protein n=1 Tax=unclassified Streptomyces TaxID=2593676 RepID=UPI00278C8877|nr:MULTISPECIES: helix-turn-helix domain-containing protein [unclassified Streptomyces]